jgi:acyl-CoA synthetase (AMP-forming)/AMP-acid ligase II
MHKSKNLKLTDAMEKKTKENNVIHLLHKNAKKNPEHIALKWEKKYATSNDIKKLYESISYRELVQKINIISYGLKKHGIKKGDRIIIFIPLSIELYLSIFSVINIGAIAATLDSWARRDHLSICSDIVKPKAMISFEKAFQLCEKIPELKNIPLKIATCSKQKHYTTNLKKLLLGKEESNIEPVYGKDTALITFTTGSSGVPKGANRTHHFLRSQHLALDKVIPYNKKDIDLSVFPIFALNNLASGITTILPKIDLASPSEDDAKVITKEIFLNSINCLTISPSIFVNIAKYCKNQKIILFTLKRVVTGGAPISKDDIKNFKKIAPLAEIFVLYGSTEVEPISHIEATQMLLDKSEREGVNVGNISDDLEYKFIKITKKNIKLCTLGWKKWEVAKNQVGELVVSGSHVCKNYYNNVGAFKRTKIQEKNGKIWHRTGDVGILKNKNLWLVGRVLNTIIRANKYLFPVQAEILLKKLIFVKEAAFLGIKDTKLGEKACAVISLTQNSSIKKSSQYINQIIKLLKQNNIPVDDVKIINKIPMDPRHHSKVEYSKLKAMLK